MLKYHAALIDPTADEVCAALTAAAAGANKRCRARKLDDKPPEWRKFARDAAAAAEGWRAWRGGRGGTPASQVVAAWWTDHAGRKHVVVRGRRVEETAARELLRETTLAERCPLWHAYPEYVYRRLIGRKVEWVCVFGCGAVGTPSSLGWMGETCGPCSDHQQEYGPRALAANRRGVLYGDRGPVWQVAASPDGRWVAGREHGGSVSGLNVWDAATGERRGAAEPDAFGLSDVAFTAAGSLLVLKYHQMSYCDPAAGPLKLKPLSDLGGVSMIVLRSPELVIRLHGVHHWIDVLRADGTARRWATLPDDVNGAVAASPDGRLVALAGAGRVLVLDLATFATVAEVPYGTPHPFSLSSGAHGPRALAFSPDGSRLFAADGGNVAAFDTRTWKRAAAGRHTHTRGAAAAAVVSCLAASPDGTHLFVADTAGRLAAFDADTLRPRVAFDWHVGYINALAVSPDGGTVYTSGADGTVKVWPMRRLLAAGSA